MKSPHTNAVSPSPSSRNLTFELRLDGVGLGSWDAADGGVENGFPVRFPIRGGAELIEVIAFDAQGEFPLTSFLIPFEGDSGVQSPTSTEVEIPAVGKALVLRLIPVPGSGGADHPLELELTYRDLDSSTDACGR